MIMSNQYVIKEDGGLERRISGLLTTAKSPRGTLAALAEDQGKVPSTYIRLLTTSCNSSSRGFSAMNMVHIKKSDKQTERQAGRAEQSRQKKVIDIVRTHGRETSGLQMILDLEH